MTVALDPASFRDPSGFIYTSGGTLYRQVRAAYRPHYDRLMSSGLYEALVGADLLIPHSEEPGNAFPGARDLYKTLRPECIPFISYPYEWCFSQLRDAALATLRIQSESLRLGMSLKDASAYNIQFRSGKPVLIDTLSFEVYKEGFPWTAYRQFCQHFLAPLALMSQVDIRLSSLLRTYIDGIPLDLASRLLPLKTRFSPGLLTHIHLHGAAQKRYESKSVHVSARTPHFSKIAFLGLIDSLESTVRKLTWNAIGTEWADYYAGTNYSDAAMAAKREIVREMLQQVDPAARTVWDLGANTGEFSQLAADLGAQTVAWDADPAAVEKNYLRCQTAGETRILPLRQDLTNPSPDLGWELRERKSMVARGPADAVLALALVHHLAIGNNVPFGRIAQFFGTLGSWLVVEFVPKSDSQVQRMLSSREDIFVDYTEELFEAEFGKYYQIVRCAKVPETNRTLYLMRSRENDG
jgi:Ribosomal protein L11 methylase